MKVALVAAPFSPSLDTDLSALTLATFTGSTPLSAGTGTQVVYYDPVSGLRSIEIKSPAGGWNFLCTVDPASAETIYGAILVDNAEAVLWASFLLPTPISINAAGQAVVLDPLIFQFPLNSPR
jgi:hypothetical protein